MHKNIRVSHPGSLEVKLNPEKMRDPRELLKAFRRLQRTQRQEGDTDEFYKQYSPENTGAFPGKVSKFFLGGNSTPHGYLKERRDYND